MTLSPKAIFLIAVVSVLSCASSFAQAESDGSGVTINKKPLRDFGVAAINAIDARKVDIGAPFRIEFDVALDNSSRIDSAKSRVTKIEGDKNAAELAKDGIIAVGESGFFGYLRHGGDAPKRLLIMVDSTKASFSVAVKVETASDSKAKTSASSLSLLLSLGAATAKPEEQLFFRNAGVAAEGRYYVIAMSLPAEVLREKVMSEVNKKAKSE